MESTGQGEAEHRDAAPSDLAAPPQAPPSGTAPGPALHLPRQDPVVRTVKLAPGRARAYGLTLLLRRQSAGVYSWENKGGVVTAGCL